MQVLGIAYKLHYLWNKNNHLQVSLSCYISTTIHTLMLIKQFMPRAYRCNMLIKQFMPRAYRCNMLIKQFMPCAYRYNKLI